MRALLTIGLLVGMLWAAPAVRAQEEATAPEPAPAQEPAEAPEEEAAEALPPGPEPPKPKSLDELLEMVRRGFEEERTENRQREEEFLRAKQDQERLLAEALATLAREEATSQRLENVYNENEPAIATLEAQLAERLGELGELFGVVRQIATDLGGQVWDSLTSSQLGPRRALLDRLGRSKGLPSTEDLEELWFELQREITEQGKVVRYQANVVTTEGGQAERRVIRAGPFSAVADGRYLLWDPREQELHELSRQPPARYVATIRAFEDATDGFTPLAVDPSRGALLYALIDTPNRTERIQQGGYVGYVIIILGVSALLLGLVRWAVISVTSRKVMAQRKRDTADSGNPLGRVLGVYEANRNVDPETLELKLDEAVLRESAMLERGLWLVKTVSVVAPLLGLLGTVTGMIQTFQAITLFGAGDPKMMAGGISEALVTTMLGLTMAIPLVLLHDTLANSTRRISDVLDEQSAGLIALSSEKIHVGS
jgi:biopolymer transport protein ExbB